MLMHTETWHVPIEEDGHFSTMTCGCDSLDEAIAELSGQVSGAFILRVTMDRVPS